MSRDREVTGIELAVQDVAGARIAKELGANRIELCSALSLGGLTPSAGLIEQAVAVGPPVHTLIRPRAGGFVYSEQEIDLLLIDVHRAVAAGSTGVVVGVLDETGMPDLHVLARCIDAAGGAEVTFHRAIDVSADILGATSMLRGTGIARILTSGGAESAFEGRETLERLVNLCGAEIQIQAGAGITPKNVRAVADTGVAAVHFSAKRAVVAHTERTELSRASFGGYETTDAGLAAATIAALRG